MPYTLGKLKQQVRLSSSSSGIRRISIRRSMCFNFNAKIIIMMNNNSNGNGVKAFFYNLLQRVKTLFSKKLSRRFLRLDLNEEPLKEWITRTAEVAGISKEETDAEGTTTEAAPLEIQIE